jgi:hypothetical protein
MGRKAQRGEVEGQTSEVSNQKSEDGARSQRTEHGVRGKSLVKGVGGFAKIGKSIADVGEEYVVPCHTMD